MKQQRISAQVDTVDKQTCKPCLPMFDNEAVQYSETYKCLLFVLKYLHWQAVSGSLINKQPVREGFVYQFHKTCLNIIYPIIVFSVKHCQT